MTIALTIVTVIVTVIIASMIRLWPYRLDLTLRHYDIDLAGGYAFMDVDLDLGAGSHYRHYAAVPVNLRHSPQSGQRGNRRRLT